MKKEYKIALWVIAIIAIIYFFKKKQSTEADKSEFLGLWNKKGSQKWADKLAKEYCRLIKELQKVIDTLNSGNGDGLLVKRQKQIEDRLYEILSMLSSYGYILDDKACTAVKRGQKTRIYKPGDQIGSECLCADRTTWAKECCKNWAPAK